MTSTSSAERRNSPMTACLSNTLQRAEVERRLKAAIQSGSPEQVEALDGSLLVGCVDWYQYSTAPEAGPTH